MALIKPTLSSKDEAGIRQVVLVAPRRVGNVELRVLVADSGA